MRIAGVEIFPEVVRPYAALCFNFQHARPVHFGEFALGVNNAVTRAIGNTLSDEKIGGSFHLTPGCCYKAAPNGNQSQLHLDIVCIQTAACGGGEIWFDGRLIRRDGIFLPESLKGLNP